MRTRHWLAAITSGCLALTTANVANAQPPGFYSNGNPDQVGMGTLPAPYTMPYGPMQPQVGYPPGANQWPNVSPFAGPPVDSTVYENGFWYNKIFQSNREYYLNVEALMGKPSKPKTWPIGAGDVVNPLSNEAKYGTTGQQNTTGSSSSTTTTTTNTSTAFTQYNQTPGGTGPVRSVNSSGTGSSGGTGGTGGTGSGTTSGTPNIFPAFDTGILSDPNYSSGMRGTFGWFNPDDTGFVMSGFFQNQSRSSFGLDDPLLNLNPNDFRNYNPLSHLHAWFGLPLLGADTDGTTLNGGGSVVGAINDGAVIGYDMGVHIDFVSRLAGGNADWYFNSIYDRGQIKIRPTAGAKYIRLQEGFSFDAYDSGMGYTISAGGSSSGSTGSSTSSGTSGTSGSGVGYLTPSALQTGFSTPNVLHSHLNSVTVGDMAGPEIGFRIDMGGKKFQLWTQTKGGALANVSNRQVNGYGIGNGFNILTGNTVPVMPNDPTATSFVNRQTTTSLSPMFEQQINFKVPIFNLIPYLNKMELFEQAQLTGGYTFLFLGDVYRPQNAIIWNQWPNTPQLNREKSNYYNSMFNIGVEWKY